jgi:hypothetical protein
MRAVKPEAVRDRMSGAVVAFFVSLLIGGGC